MARIRTIKPDFWTDEKLTECSLSARLLFIGLLNFADDNGNLTRSAKKIKMQIFPADVIDCEPLLTELTTHGVLIEYSVNGDKYLHIKGFLKHQLINRPSKSNIPAPSFNEDSLNAHGALTDGEEGKGRERKGKDKELKSSATATDPCPHQKIIELYHETLPELMAVREWTDDRQAKLRSRWKEKPERQSLEWWAEFFAYVSQSDFLMARTDKPFACSLEWLVSPKNFVKVIEGKYENRSAR